MLTSRLLGAACGKRHVSGGEIDVLEPTLARKVWWAFGNERGGAALAAAYEKKYNDVSFRNLSARVSGRLTSERKLKPPPTSGGFFYLRSILM
jgi:hypothetical protein